MAKPTPDSVAEQLAAAEAEAQRLRDRQRAIGQAEQDARHATEVRLYREAYKTLPDAARVARDQAGHDLDALAAADELDLPALLAAFDRWQQLDAEAGACATIANRLDRIDPLPAQRTTGHPASRSPQSQRLHARASFSQWLDELIRSRADSRQQQRSADIHAEIDQQVEADAAEARDKAAAGQPLTIEQLPSIRELHEQAKTTIDPDEFDEDKIRAAGFYRVQAAAEQDALEHLVREGN